MVLSNDIAALVGFTCEAVLWGAYVILFLASVILLLYRLRAPRRNLNIPILIANCLLFLSCTAHFALEFNHYYVTLKATGMVAGFANETMPLVGADVLISFCDLLGDLILLYRCWIIWGKNVWIVLTPLVTAAGGFACVMGVAHLVVTMDPTAPVPPVALVPLGLAGYGLPLATNFMTTALIAGRLYASARRAEQRVGTVMSGTMRAAQRAVAIIVESGALYLATQAVFVLLFALGHPAQAIIAVIAVQIYGIAPTLIVIRVALGMSSDDTAPFDNPSLTHIVGADQDPGIPPARPTFIPAIRTTDTSSTIDSTGARLSTPLDGELTELKSFELEYRDGLAVAV